MPLNVIGILNVNIGLDEYVINEHLKLVSRDFFEKNDISMSPDIRFYKTFIVGTYEFGTDLNSISNESKAFFPIYLLWAMRLYLNEINLENSSWFSGESYENLKEYIKVSNGTPANIASLLQNWADFKIDNITKDIDLKALENIIIIFEKIQKLYISTEESAEQLNLHWMYALTKYNEVFSDIEPTAAVTSITSALEFLLVNTSNESDYRAALFAALLSCEKLEDRKFNFDLLRWTFNVRDKLSGSLVPDLIMDKCQLPENLLKLKEILGKVLLFTIDLSPLELQEKLDNIILSAPIN